VKCNAILIFIDYGYYIHSILKHYGCNSQENPDSPGGRDSDKSPKPHQAPENAQFELKNSQYLSPYIIVVWLITGRSLNNNDLVMLLGL
jgi:hypothetical protein